MKRFRGFVCLWGHIQPPITDEEIAAKEKDIKRLRVRLWDYNEGTANFAFVEPEREYGPAPFGRRTAWLA